MPPTSTDSLGGSFHVTHRTSIPMTRILAPVLVLLALLLATGLAALGSWVLQRRKEGERVDGRG